MITSATADFIGFNINGRLIREHNGELIGRSPLTIGIIRRARWIDSILCVRNLIWVYYRDCFSRLIGSTTFFVPFDFSIGTENERAGPHQIPSVLSPHLLKKTQTNNLRKKTWSEWNDNSSSRGEATSLRAKSVHTADSKKKERLKKHETNMI